MTFIKRKFSIVFLMVCPVFFFSTNMKSDRHSDIKEIIEAHKIDKIDSEINNYKSLIKTNLSQMELDLFFQNNKFKTIK